LQVNLFKPGDVLPPNGLLDTLSVSTAFQSSSSHPTSGQFETDNLKAMPRQFSRMPIDKMI